MPGLVKVKVKVLPQGESGFERLVGSGPGVLTRSWLVTVIVVPDLTVSAAGVNAKSCC